MLPTSKLIRDKPFIDQIGILLPKHCQIEGIHIWTLSIYRADWDSLFAYKSISSKIGVWSCLAPESIISEALILSAMRSEVIK